MHHAAMSADRERFGRDASLTAAVIDGQLAVDHRLGRARLPSGPLVLGQVVHLVDPLDRPLPQREIALRRAPRQQVFPHHPPLATRREQVEDCAQHLARIHRPRPATTLGRTDQRLHQHPLGICHIVPISKLVPVCRAPMRYRPAHNSIRESARGEANYIWFQRVNSFLGCLPTPSPQPQQLSGTSGN